MNRLIASLLLIFSFVQPGNLMTVEQCATRFGFSHVVLNEHLAQLTGLDIGEMYVEVLSAVAPSGILYYETDTGIRQIWVYFYQNREYWFFPRHRDDPGAGLDHGHHHGACMWLRGDYDFVSS